jgi:hypothetical protein
MKRTLFLEDSMKRLTLSMLIAIAALVGVTRPAAAQVLIGPSTALFAHADADFTLTASYQLDVFQCTSLVAGACQGQAVAPMQSIVVPKANVTSFSPDANGDNRSINLKAAPVSMVLPSMPAGVPFVLAVAAVGDPNAGAIGTTVDSGPSSPFFAAGKLPAVPTAVRVK